MAATDIPPSGFNTLSTPAIGAAAVSPDDTNTLSYVTRGLYVGGSGNVNVVLVSQSTNTVFTAVPAGSILPIRVSKVNNTNTTATSIVAMW